MLIDCKLCIRVLSGLPLYTLLGIGILCLRTLALECLLSNRFIQGCSTDDSSAEFPGEDGSVDSMIGCLCVFLRSSSKNFV